MNKNWIVTTLLLYLAALAVFGYLLLNRKSREILTVAIATETREVPILKSARQSNGKDYSLIVKNDLFHPLRGKAPTEGNGTAAKKTGPPARFKFDLRGVFRSGERYGAIILVGGNKPNSKGDFKKANGEIFFQGAEIVDGCVLQKVGSNSITILQNGEELTVKLEKLQPPDKNGEQEKTNTKKEDTPRRTP